jgi:hypothetical protein
MDRYQGSIDGNERDEITSTLGMVVTMEDIAVEKSGGRCAVEPNILPKGA